MGGLVELGGAGSQLLLGDGLLHAVAIAVSLIAKSSSMKWPTS